MSEAGSGAAPGPAVPASGDPAFGAPASGGPASGVPEPVGAGPAGGPRSGAGPGSVLVIGYGNPLRSDDGVGPAVIARLDGDPRLAGVDLRAAHQLTPELAADVAGVSLLILVDAGVGEAPGDVAVRRIEPPSAAALAGGEGAWTHHVDPAGLLGLALALYGAAPPLVMVSVGPASMELGEGLSETVVPAVTRAADLVATIVERHRRS